jgi:hypothetical protein
MNWKSLLGTTLSAVSLWGILPILYSSAAIQPAVAQNTSVNINTKFKTFVEAKRYSISYPQGWFVRRESRDLTYISNRKIGGAGEFPDGFIKTEVEIVNQKFPNALTTNVSLPKEDGSRLVKKQNIKVDGKNAVRLWFTGREGEMLITLLPYKQNQTTSIVSFYTKNSSKITPTIQYLHSSFKSLN